MSLKKFVGKINRVLSKLKRKKLVETTISVRTLDLAAKVKTICDFNAKLALLTFLSAALTALTTMDEFGKVVTGYLDDNKENLDIPIFAIILCLISIFVLLLSLYSFTKQIKTYNPTKFVNDIIKEQYEIEEYTAIFVIKAMFENIPKILVFRSETWNSYFLPYCHYDPKLTGEEIKSKIKLPLAELLEVTASDLEIYDDFNNKTYVAIKKNPSYKSMSKINYRFYYVRFSNGYLARRFLNTNMKHFSWKSKYELAKDIDTQLNNGDIVSIIDELALIDQSKVAFSDRAMSSYEIPSKYNIIWNITDECYYDCPICATNSGKSCTCPTSYQDKLNILLNLSSINGYINKLDISGGDPLKNKDDREIIKKANQILAYTDIKVTTTGDAIQKLSFEEMTETIKKCDITYDIPYEVCNDELQKYREYSYNYHNFRQLEKLSNSGVNLELNIHIPILPAVTKKKMVAMILEDINRINPTEVKFIRLMPVGRMDVNELDEYTPETLLNTVSDIIKKEKYKFNISYNCSLGTRLTNKENKGKPIRECGMLKQKLGIDCRGKVYACIWGAYIQGVDGVNYKSNPFYLGDLMKETMYEILTKSSTLKLLKNIDDMKEGCRVCAYVNARKNKKDVIGQSEARKIMMEAEDPLKVFNESNLNRT